MESLILLILLAQVPFEPVREVKEVGMLGDVLSHCDKTLYYENPITLFHENVHRANSMVNKKYKKPGFYLLNNQAMVIEEPKITALEVAGNIPHSLRGHASYKWYLIEVPNKNLWNNKFPSYIFDEWIAFTETAEYRAELHYKNQPQEIEYAVAFAVYSVVTLMSHDYDQSTFEFVKYQLNKTRDVYKQSEGLPRDGAEEFLAKFLSVPDCKPIREFMKNKLDFEF